MVGDNNRSREECCFSPETIDRIHSIDEKFEKLFPLLLSDIPQMKLLLSTVASAQTAMATAASSMAETNRKAELRYEKLEDRLQNANDRASGKGQIPIVSHYLILGGTVLISVLIVLWVNKQTLDATLSSIKIGQDKTQKLLEKEVEIKKETF